MRNLLHFVMVFAAALSLSGGFGCREQSEGDKQLEQAASEGHTAAQQPGQAGQPAEGDAADDEAMDEGEDEGAEGEPSGQ